MPSPEWIGFVRFSFYLYLSATFVTVRQLIPRARKRYRWDTQPTPGASSDAYCRSL
jgi:hypothetical protein